MQNYKRLLAMGDIHGHYKEMCACLDKCGYNPRYDKLVLLGDYVDRGPDSKLVVEKIQTLVAGGATAVLGNHEILMIKAVGNKSANPISAVYKAWSDNNGGDATINSFRHNLGQMRKAIKFIAKMPLYYETDGFVFAHGAVNTKNEKGQCIPLDKHLTGWFVWNRHMDNPQVKFNDKIVVVGHTPVQFIRSDENYCEPIITPSAIYLDTGAVLMDHAPGRLTIMDMFSGEYWQASKDL